MGTVVRGKTVRIAHLSQELAELDPGRRVLETVQDVRSFVRVGKREISASQMLERFGFRGDKQWTPVGELSGGERRRLQLLRLLMDGPNVLLLDEPTNDLDIETLTELEDLLDGWPGSMTVVSHDRYFLERVTDHVVALLGDGKLSFLAGGVEQYLDQVRGTREASLPAPAGPPGRASAASAAGGPSPAAPAPPDGTAPGTAEERAARKELQRLERQIDRLSGREAQLGAQMAENASDYEKLTQMGADLRSVRADKAALEERWLSVAGRPGSLRPWQRRCSVRRFARSWPAARKRTKLSGPRLLRRQGVEGGEQGPQQPGERALVVRPQRGEQFPLAAQQVRQRVIGCGPALVGEGDEHTAPVPRVGFPADESRLGEPVDPVGHGARGDQRRADQRSRRHLIRRPLSAQGRQHVELPRLEPATRERGPPGEVKVPRQPGYPAQHLHGLDVQIGPLRVPRGHQIVYLVAHRTIRARSAVEDLRAPRRDTCPRAQFGTIRHCLRISLDVKMPARRR